MTSFSIDDVRETMPREVTAFLANIEQSAAAFLEVHPPNDGGADTPASELLRSIRHCGHAIYGTSSLVAATTLAECADLVERLAEHGHAELVEAQERIARARRVVELLPDGVEQMRSVLQLTLEHQDDDAQWLVADWKNRASNLLSALVEVPHPVVAPSLHPIQELDSPASPTSSSPSEFSFEDWDPNTSTVLRALEKSQVSSPTEMGSPHAGDTAENLGDPVRALPPTDEAAEFQFDDEPAPVAENAALQAELIAIFQEEAREAVVALQGHLNTLATESGNCSAATPLERIYHTLKGAAATVGLTEVSRCAEKLQLGAEELIGLTEPVNIVTLTGFVDDTNALFALAGLDQLCVSLPPRQLYGSLQPKPDISALFPEFLVEAKEIYEQAATLIAELSSPVGTRYPQSVLATLAPLFHRLKGSAHLVGESEVAALVGSLEEECDGTSIPTTATLSLGLARVAAKLGLLLVTHEPEDATEESRLTSALRHSFENEARDLLDDALSLARDLHGSAAAPEMQSELAKVFHHLGGSALIVGNSVVAEEARSLEGLVNAQAGITDQDLSTLNDRLGMLRARFGSSSRTDLLQSSASEHNVREPVEFVHAEELWETFIAECAELMDSIERTAFALEESVSPKEQFRNLMRYVHTLKGVVNTIGLTPTGRILHRVEDLLETLLSAAILPPLRRLATLIIEVQAEVRRNLKDAPTGFIETSPKRLDERIAMLLAGGNSAQESQLAAADSINNRPSEARPSDSRASTSVASVGGGGTDRHVIRVATERLDALMNLAGELVVSRSRLTSRVQRLRILQAELAHGGRRLIDTVDSFCEEHEFANLDGKRRILPAVAMSNSTSKFTDDVGRSPNPTWGTFTDLELDQYDGIHVLSRSLTELASDFSELHSQLSRGLSAFADDADIVGAIVNGIQTEVTHARMIPLEALFLRLRLPLHDAALRGHKEVRVVVRGEDVPVDKSIADALFQPMLHLVRNAVAHGIEDADRRERAGKPREGTVTLEARQESGQIVIEVRDDGAGLDRNALRARGVQMGVLSPDIPIDDPRVIDMVFVAGLSTHGKAGDVAGRGMGGEIVKRAVDRLNGSIRIESYTGQGTAFLIRLPLTLAIARALVVRHAEQSFAIPIHFAERIIDAQEQKAVHLGDIRRIKLDGAFMPVRTLGEFFGFTTESNDEGPILILRVGDARIALQVDAIVAHEEIVVKSLGELLTGHPSFSGITIRGTGDLVLIVDVPSLIDAKGVSIVNHAATTRDHAADGVPEPTVAAIAKASPTVAAIAKASPTVLAAHPPVAQRQRVLFVDDSLSVRKVAEMQLRELDVDVVTAVDGLDAIAKLREHKIDILFTDLEMPRMNGYELIRELRFLPAYRELPIIVVTSRSGRKHQEQAKQLGASEYLTKPFTAQVLGGALAKWARGAECPAPKAVPVEETSQ
jgi:chemosensory pili system protein ChpA (sensor histidine kinase/response regulator)